MSEDNTLVNILADAAWDHLDQQYLNNGEPYIDIPSELIDGTVNMESLVRAILKALREEEGE
jgi:hypothetical protein